MIGLLGVDRTDINDKIVMQGGHLWTEKNVLVGWARRVRFNGGIVTICPTYGMNIEIYYANFEDALKDMKEAFCL